MSKRPDPIPDGNGGYLPNGAKDKSRLNKSISDVGWYTFFEILTYKAAVLGKNIIAVHRGLYQPGVFRLWRYRRKITLNPHPQMPVRVYRPQGSQRGDKYFAYRDGYASGQYLIEAPSLSSGEGRGAFTGWHIYHFRYKIFRQYQRFISGN
ncbi:MAG: hypothetical protein PVI90_11835, partial [Desulfobacteraceae bacterium]|jgi:hypothetical protein